MTIEVRDAVKTADNWNEKYLDYKKWCEFAGIPERARLNFVQFCNARANAGEQE